MCSEDAVQLAGILLWVRKGIGGGEVGVMGDGKTRQTTFVSVNTYNCLISPEQWNLEIWKCLQFPTLFKEADICRLIAAIIIQLQLKI